MPWGRSSFTMFQEHILGTGAKYSWIDMRKILFLGQLRSDQGPWRLGWSRVPEVGKCSYAVAAAAPIGQRLCSSSLWNALFLGFITALSEAQVAQIGQNSAALNSGLSDKDPSLPNRSSSWDQGLRAFAGWGRLCWLSILIPQPSSKYRQCTWYASGF